MDTIIVNQAKKRRVSKYFPFVFFHLIWIDEVSGTVGLRIQKQLEQWHRLIDFPFERKQ